MPDPRPPLRRDQRIFWRVIGQGLGVEDASARVGVGVRTGHRWFGKAGGMPPLSLVEPLHPGALSIAEREVICRGVLLGASLRSIAAGLGRATSTISRELRTNMRHRRSHANGDSAGRLRALDWVADWDYSPARAQRRADAQLARPKSGKLAGHDRLRGEVQDRLMDEHSPEQISSRLRTDFPDDPLCCA
jgi:IS30 family transposase